MNRVCLHRISNNALSDPKSSYLWDNSRGSEVSLRFQSLKTIYDNTTFYHLQSLGVSEGWKCLEVGGGAGSVSKWLSDKVGSNGRVLVTDISPQFLADLRGGSGNVDVLEHDITLDSGIPKDSFDLAHARLVLVHLPNREKALANMVSTLKPGGWVMIEDFDHMNDQFPLDYHAKLGTPPTMSTELLRKIMKATRRLLEQHGADLAYARNLYSMLRANGLVDVQTAVGGFNAWSGGTAGAQLRIANSLQSRNEILATGVISEKEFDEAISMMRDPEWKVYSPLMISAWGRRPK